MGEMKEGLVIKGIGGGGNGLNPPKRE